MKWLEFLESIKKEKQPVNGIVVLLHEQHINFKLSSYHLLKKEDWVNLKPFLIINTDMSNGDIYVCKLIKHENNESWPFNGIYLVDENGKTDLFQLDLKNKYIISEFNLGFNSQGGEWRFYLDCLDKSEPKVESEITNSIYRYWSETDNKVIFDAINHKMQKNKGLRKNWEKNLNFDSEITHGNNLRTINNESDYPHKKFKKDNQVPNNYIEENKEELFKIYKQNFDKNAKKNNFNNSLNEYESKTKKQSKNLVNSN